MAKVCKFQLEKQLVSYDCGETWRQTGVTRKKNQPPVERYSPDCGWSDSFQYRWVDDTSGYTCVGYNKYSTRHQQVSYDQGESWEDVPGSTNINQLLEKFSTSCCQIRTTSGETCDELFRKVNASIQEASLDGETWIQTGYYTIDSVISGFSPDCAANADLQYIGVPASGSTGTMFTYRYYEDSAPLYPEDWYETVKYTDSGYVLIDCNDSYSYHDRGGIEEIYVLDCCTHPFSSVDAISTGYNSHSTLKKIHISSGVTGVFGSILDNSTLLEEIDGLENSHISGFDTYALRNSAIKELVLPETCSMLGWDCFADCLSLSSVTITAKYLTTNTSTQGGQFNQCYSLQTVTFPNDYSGTVFTYMFYGCTNLTGVTLGNPTAIGDYAFNGCSHLATINLGNAINSIGANAFHGCSALTDVYVYRDDGVPSHIMSTSFPDGCTIHVPCAVYPGWQNIFSSQSGITIEMLDDECITERWVESGTTCVGYDKHTQMMKQISYDDGGSWYDTDTFSAGTLIETDSTDCGYIPQDYYIKVEYGDGTQRAKRCECRTDGTVVSSHLLFDNEKSYTKCWIQVCSECDVPTRRLGSEAFRYSTVQEVYLPALSDGIGAYAFYGCTALTTVDMSNVSGSIGDHAFVGCYSLRTITIPTGITVINYQAFLSCTGLTSITFESTTPPTLQKYGQSGSWFDSTNNCPIYVPASAVETYKTATNWSTYASRIQPIPA